MGSQMAEADLKAALLQKLLQYHRGKAEALLAQHYASALTG